MSTEAEASLATALQNLRVAWDEVRGFWRDEKAIQFEAAYLKDLPTRTAQAAAMIADLEKILKKARNDCG